MCPHRRRAQESTCGRDVHAQLLCAERSPGGLGRGACATCFAASMSRDMLRGRRQMSFRRLQCFPLSYPINRAAQSTFAVHDCVPYRCCPVCVCGSWSVAGAVGTFMEAVSRCVLAVYTSYQLYIAVWTRERPPVHVRCAICKKRLTSFSVLT